MTENEIFRAPRGAGMNSEEVGSRMDIAVRL